MFAATACSWTSAISAQSPQLTPPFVDRNELSAPPLFEYGTITLPSIERLTSRICPSPVLSIPRPSASQTSSCGSYAMEGSLIRGQGPGGVALTVVPGRPPVVHVRPPFCEVENTRLLEPPPPYQR